MHKHFILLLVMFLGSHVPTGAQTLTPRIVLAQQHVLPTITILKTTSTPMSARFIPMAQGYIQSPARLNRPFAGAYQHDYSLEPIPPKEEAENLIHTVSNLPLFQLWGGRLQLGVFQSTPRFGPVVYGGMSGFRFAAQSYPSYPGGPHSGNLSLSFHFGRDVRTGRPTKAWQRLSGIVSAALN
jgi:hypothetical protein